MVNQMVQSFWPSALRVVARWVDGRIVFKCFESTNKHRWGWQRGWKATTLRWQKLRRLWRRSRRTSSPQSLTASSTLLSLQLPRLALWSQLQFFWQGWGLFLSDLDFIKQWILRWTCPTTPTSSPCFSPSWSLSHLTPLLLDLASISAPLSHRFPLLQNKSFSANVQDRLYRILPRMKRMKVWRDQMQAFLLLLRGEFFPRETTT